jgi:AraC family transcriptional regulator of adaptative response / DNA-3-methyladenine glycosylase II
LVEAGFLDRHSVEQLSDKLGVGSRHLSRLFRKHLGATPKDIAATRRVQLAKRLVTETDRPLAEIAFAAGFNSIRRFNDAFSRTYHRPPSRFRFPTK